jgi:hypothetical protein
MLSGISAEESTGTARDLGATPTRRMGKPPFSATAGARASLIRDSGVVDLRRRGGAAPAGPRTRQSARRSVARRRSAVLDAPKIRFRTSATSLRGACGPADSGVPGWCW